MTDTPAAEQAAEHVSLAASSRADAPATPPPRCALLDALRGLAIVWMVGFHAAFDLNWLGFIQPRWHFTRDPLWTTQRTLIVSLFMLCAGLALALTLRAAPARPRFWRRWAQIAACATGVSIGSAWLFPHSWISFGVLHAMAAMQLILHPLRERLGRTPPWRLLALGALAIALPQVIADPWFDTRWTNPLGPVTRKPVTEDWVPLLPWSGLLLWGLAAGRALPAAWLARPLPRASGPLQAIGRWPLTVYMLHQPLLLGLLWAWRSWRPAG
ncbi:MAG: hypothetical protein RL223_4665 [Pseudomonadota bacterium]